MLGPSLRQRGGGSYVCRKIESTPHLLGRNDPRPKRPTNIGRIDSPQILVETTHGGNDSRPKQPTNIGRIDSPQNLAETTHGRNDLDSYSPNTTSQINIIRHATVLIQKSIKSLFGKKQLFTCIGHGNKACFITIYR